VHLGAARRRQTQRRSRRLDRGVASEKAGAPGRAGARQQAGENLLGDHDHWRSLPPGDLRQGVESPSRVWRVQRDVMNDMAAANRRGQPANRHQREARHDDRGPRLSDLIRASGHQRRTNSRIYDRSRPVRSKRQKTACQPGPSTYDGFHPNAARFGFISFWLRPSRETRETKRIFRQAKRNVSQRRS
jgi:hypothetical protein